ncbi:MAG: 50S ribosomal protein L10 [Candidatus Omnitrophota bacterium]
MAEKYGKKVRELVVNEMKDVFSEKKGFVFSTINDIKASEIDILRKQMRHSGARYLVLKNRLAGIALKELGIEGVSDVISGKSILGVGIIDNDPVLVAKLMMEFSKKNTGFEVSKGYLEGQVLGKERIKELAELPSREQLITMIVSTINAPISRFVGVLGSVLKSILYTLNAVKDKKMEDRGQKIEDVKQKTE